MSARVRTGRFWAAMSPAFLAVQAGFSAQAAESTKRPARIARDAGALILMTALSLGQVVAVAHVEPHHGLVRGVDRAVGDLPVGRDEEGLARLLMQQPVAEEEQARALELAPDLLAPRAVDMGLGDVEL